MTLTDLKRLANSPAFGAVIDRLVAKMTVKTQYKMVRPTRACARERGEWLKVATILERSAGMSPANIRKQIQKAPPNETNAWRDALNQRMQQLHRDRGMDVSDFYATEPKRGGILRGDALAQAMRDVGLTGENDLMDRPDFQVAAGMAVGKVLPSPTGDEEC
jgi:hypothetical protein